MLGSHDRPTAKTATHSPKEGEGKGQDVDKFLLNDKKVYSIAPY